MTWLNKLLERIQAIWKKWNIVQKLTFAGIIVGVGIAMILLVVFSGTPSMVPLLTRPITDEQLLDSIAVRLDQENVEYQITADQRIVVDSQRTARRLRTLLTRENLIPTETDPWELFDMERWTQTEFERNVNLQRSITRQLELHLEAIDDIDSATVSLVIPDPQLFAEDQNPPTAAITILAKPGSDLRETRSKIEGVQKLIQFAVEGLTAENITITDRSGRILNDFEGSAEFDRIELTRRELKLKRELEQRYINAITNALGEIYTNERIEIINIDVDLNMATRTQEIEEHYPIVTVPDNPDTPFDEREFVLSVPRSEETIAEQYEGTGFNPEGPPGQEGQVPPAYRDLEGVVGRWENNEQRINNELNTRRIYEESSPEVTRITASIAIDGIWKKAYSEEGDLIINPDGSIQREYTPVPGTELTQAEELIRDAIGYNPVRGDSVSVRHIQFDRAAEFALEDIEYQNIQQRQNIVLYVLIGFVVILMLFIMFRLFRREADRRRRLREEELARQHAAIREANLRDEEGGTRVQMSIEEMNKLELQENTINLARENPENAANLIKTWMMER